MANAITGAIPQESGGGPWEVRVFQDDSANAFALPGRNIVVHTWLLNVVLF